MRSTPRAPRHSETGLGKTAVPTGVLTRIVQLIVHIPAKDAVTETTTFFQQTNKLFEADVLAANNAIEVRQSQFDTRDPARLILGKLVIQQ